MEMLRFSRLSPASICEYVSISSLKLLSNFWRVAHLPHLSEHHPYTDTYHHITCQSNKYSLSFSFLLPSYVFGRFYLYNFDIHPWKPPSLIVKTAFFDIKKKVKGKRPAEVRQPP